MTPKKNNARRIPVPLKKEVQAKLNELEHNDVIAKVKQPTDWINSMVAVKKPNKLRIYIDPANLNVAIKRNHYPTPTVDDIMPNLTKARVFSFADAKDGFLQVTLMKNLASSLHSTHPVVYTDGSGCHLELN